MANKKMVYPVVFTPAKEGGYDVYIPDFDKNTQGDDLADAIDMARDAIEMMGVYYEDEKKAIPPPTDINVIDKAGGVVTLISADFAAYRKKKETRVIKKTLSIPSWLNVEAEAAGINFSATLQEALKQKLST